MCGIFGAFGLGCRVGLSDADLVRVRDTLSHRGPDDAGAWRCDWAVLGHRRLAVIAPGAQGHQPMVSPDGRHALVYNGELYNDVELRAQLGAQGVRFRTPCDTETVLAALIHWGDGAVGRLRGMFALGFVDRDLGRVVLARDPLGIKPLYAARVSTPGGVQVVFASEPKAVLAHPDMAVRPDWVGVSAYLTTIRPTLAARTMFEGVETLAPGEARVYDAFGDGAARVVHAWDFGAGAGGDAGRTAEIVRDSVARHLRTDVPMCALLSGGLDSAVIVREAVERVGGMRTYCAGARGGALDDDFAHARVLAGVLGTRHTEVVVDQGGFVGRWAEMVTRTGLPLSTPNEVAIYEVSRALRGDGHVVALSGEGADELFGGYGPPMLAAAAHVAGLGGRADADGGLFHLRSNAWVGVEQKGRVLSGAAWAGAGGDAALEAEYLGVFRGLLASSPGGSAVGVGSGLQPHLRFHRAMNLPNLLRRLDSATMLASVEGRTPLADIEVARFAESLPMAEKFVADGVRTKVALREAFRAVLPASVVERPKASFPLPFEGWMGPLAGTLMRTGFAREVFSAEARAAVAASPASLWNLAWPMLNVAMWGERWWGAGVGVGVEDAEARGRARPPPARASARSARPRRAGK